MVLAAGLLLAAALPVITDAQRLEVKTLEARYFRLRNEILLAEREADKLAKAHEEAVGKLKAGCEVGGGVFDATALKCNPKPTPPELEKK